MESRSLLQIVNDVMVSLDLDQVSSITESTEAAQVAAIIRNEYYKLAADEAWDHVLVATRLDGLSDTNRPTMMKLPTTLAEVDVIKYDNTETGDTNKTITDITFYENPNDFLDLVHNRNSGDSNVLVKWTESGSQGVPVFILNDVGPTFCTTFDGTHIVFDAYNAVEDSTLQSSKSIALGLQAAAWTASETFVPDLPVRLFPLFTSKCKITANEQLRQVSLAQEKRDFAKSYNKLQRRHSIENKATKPNYGRNR